MFTKIDLCLLCLTNHSKLKSISSSDTDGVIIEEKLKFFISKQIKIEPENSVLCICLPCLEKLNSVCNYKRLCLQNIGSLNTFISKDKLSCNVQVTLTDLKDSITTENCTVVDTNNSEIQPELAKENNELECFKEELDENEMKFEFVSVAIKKEPEFNSDAFLNETDDNEGPTNISGNTNTKLLKCDVCDKIFNHKSSLRRHKHLHKSTTLFKCDVCEKTFSQKPYLMAHKRFHSGNNSLNCEICNKTFINQSHLARHKIVHSVNKPFKCDLCDKEFGRNSSLLAHISCHTGNKRHKCDECDKAFTLKSQLNRHKLTHSGIKAFKCDMCDKAFYRDSNLKIHKRCHSEDRNYSCDLCGNSFKHSTTLLKHKRRHAEKNE